MTSNVENDVNHNLFKMAAPCRYIRVHDGKACITSSVCTKTVQAMDYTFNIKGLLTLVINLALNQSSRIDHAYVTENLVPCVFSNSEHSIVLLAMYPLFYSYR